jgi:hypothetical protein
VGETDSGKTGDAGEHGADEDSGDGVVRGDDSECAGGAA